MDPFSNVKEFLSPETQRNLMLEEGKYSQVSDYLAGLEAAIKSRAADSLTDEEKARQRRNLACCERLVDWMQANGAVLNKVKVHYFSKFYRGIVTEKETEVGPHQQVNERLLFVPRRLLLTYEDSMECGLVKHAVDSGLLQKLKSTSHTPLAIFLLVENEKGDESFFAPYIRTFPEKVEGLPIDFEEEELAQLEVSPILETIRKRKQNLLADYELLQRELPSFDRFSFADFKHFRNLIGSRVFGLEINGKKTGAMVPFAGRFESPDMINHKCPKLSSWNYSAAKHGFVLDSMGAIGGGIEVFDSYGNKCNAKFFVNYGFLEDIPDSFEYLFYYHMNPEEPFYQAKAELISAKGDGYRLLLSLDYESENMIKRLRLLLIDREEDLELARVLAANLRHSIHRTKTASSAKSGRSRLTTRFEY